MRYINVLVAVLCACVGVWCIGCGGPRKEAKPPVPQKAPKEGNRVPPLYVEVEALSLQWVEPGTPGKVLWQAEVPRAQVRNTAEGATGTFENVRSILYKEGKPTTDLQARRVEADQRRWRVEGSGGVSALSRINGVRLQAQKVIWFARQNRLVAQGDVMIEGRQFQLKAQEVELDTAMQVMRVTKP